MWLGAGAAADELDCPRPSIAAPQAEPVAFGHGLLWRLEAGGDRPVSPSFLFGTIHVSDPAVVEVAEPVRRALDDSRAFVMEAMFDPDSVAGFAKAMTLPEGRTLEAIAGPALFERSRALLAQFDVPTEAVQRMRPWAAFMTLNQPRDDGGTPLDLVLMQRAIEAGKPVDGIETLGEQAEVFGGFSEAEQVAMLRDTVCNFDRVQADIERLRESYLARDLQSIVRMTEEFQGSDPALSRRMLSVLIDDRNERMAARLGPWLEQGGVFIAVGALHLPGERGLLSLLSRRGYRAVRVY
jgi:hypothetical protein